MTSFRAVRHLGGSAVVFTVFIGVASCGSRTALFGSDDGAFDPTGQGNGSSGGNDAGRDARFAVDADRDARLADATADVIEEPVACIPGTFTFTPATAQLMFVLDRSGSMKFGLTVNSEVPQSQWRWTALASALGQTITSFSDQIAMGARFFPSANADGSDPIQACIQDPPSAAITPALGNVPNILNVFDTTAPIGGTPTALAIQQAAQDVSSSRAVARAMVVATDGVPNCNAQLDGDTCVCTSVDPNACKKKNGATNGGTSCLDDIRTIQAIATVANTKNIPVFVIGIGVTGNFADTLDAMAVAGGRPRPSSPKYFAADTPSELTEAFKQVRDSVAKCSYITPSSPDDPDAISVEIGGQLLFRDPNHLDGWDWIDQAYGQLQLFGPACDVATATNLSGTVACDPRDK